MLFGYRCGYQTAAQRQDFGAGRKFLTYLGPYLHTTPPSATPHGPQLCTCKTLLRKYWRFFGNGRLRFGLAKLLLFGCIWSAHLAHNLKVVGSNPTPATIKCTYNQQVTNHPRGGLAFDFQDCRVRCCVRRSLEVICGRQEGSDVSLWAVRPLFAAEIRRKRIQQKRAHSNWQWHLDEVFVKINGETHYLWRAVDHEGEVLEPLSLNAGIARRR